MTCENCGQPGEMTEYGQTFCPACLTVIGPYLERASVGEARDSDDAQMIQDMRALRR